MPDPAGLTRPRQVTMAGWTTIIGSALVVVAVFETMAGLNSIETREAVEKFLAEPGAAGLGLDVPGALTALRVTATIAAGCAAAAAILGFHVLKGNKGARVGLSVIAVPLFFAGFVVGGFLSSLVAASAALLWLAPSRAWFNGEEPPSGAAPATRPPAAPFAPPDRPRADQQAPTSATSSNPVAAPALRRPSYVDRPNAVVVACVLTWVLCTLAVVLTVMGAWLVAANPDLVWSQLERQDPALLERGLTQRALEVSTQLTAVAATLWSAAAAAFAALAYRRVPWARVALMVSAGLAGLVCLVASLGSLLLVVPAVGCAMTFSLLLRPEVREWFTPRGEMEP